MEIDNSIAAIVTGAASGLGYAAAKALAASGVKVGIFDMNAEKGEEVAQELDGVFCEVDITSPGSVEAGFSKARRAHGQERVLINCAGGGRGARTAQRDRKTGEIRTHDVNLFEHGVQLNLIGTFRMITHFVAGAMALDPMANGERGVIVNTASVAAVEGQVGQVAYAASKAGIVGMTLPIARDLGNEGIRINTIMPGLMATPPMMAVPEELLASLSAQVPFPKRLGDPSEFASLVLEMVRNGYFNGETVRLDGAIRMGPK